MSPGYLAWGEYELFRHLPKVPYLTLLPTRSCPPKIGLGLSLALCQIEVLDFSSCADISSSVAGAPIVLCPPFVFFFFFFSRTSIESSSQQSQEITMRLVASKK